MTATLLYKEYGFKGIWVSLVAYASAIVTGMTRILNNRHWIIDVIVGAALGILLTEMAYRLVKQYLKTENSLTQTIITDVLIIEITQQ